MPQVENSLYEGGIMINTILFDLDGTLLHFGQAEFIETYFAELAKVFAKKGLSPEEAVKAVWAGTKAMMLNDGSKPNTERFWDTFAEVSGVSNKLLMEIEAACDDFYTNEFNLVKSIIKHSDVPKRLIKMMKEKGYTLVLATNPLFPECGVISRLGWGEIDSCDFTLLTHYGNSAFCKPNLGYYRDILTIIGKNPEECLMVGNNPAEDMIAGELGMKTFLVTNCLENEMNLDISNFQHGSIEELETYLSSLPDVQ